MIAIQSGSTGRLAWAAGSATGGQRDVNEDDFAVAPEDGLFVVADGCGGMASGRPAASRTVAHVVRRGSSSSELPAPADAVAAAIVEANALVFREAQNPAALGMGCTVAALRLGKHFATLAHVGDCRIGRLAQPFVRRSEVMEPSEIHWLTRDHLLWLEALDMGMPDETVAEIRRDHPMVVTRAIGMAERTAVDVQYCPIATDEVFLLCTNGVSAQLDRTTIGRILRTNGLPDAVDALLRACEDAGGNDNATAIVVRTISASRASDLSSSEAMR